MDGLEESAEAAKGKLIYPFAEIPQRGHSIEVAPGVHWIRMPLPYSLDHINLWALDDGAGWAVVDTGVRTEETVAVWRELFANSPDTRGLTRVFVTHMHPDHVGMAGWLTRKFGVRLWMTRSEYLMCRVMVSDTGREAPDDAIAFYRRAGWSDAAIETYRTRFGNFGKHIHPLPDSFRRLRDGEVLQIGAHAWRVVTGNGHSPEHACLYCPDLKVLISGDQILPRISSNVSVSPAEPDADPMADWLASLAKLKREIPDDVLVLPSHGKPFRGLHTRIAQLRQHHVERLAEVMEACREEWRSAADIVPLMFRRPLDAHQLSFALGEALAHLHKLWRDGIVRRECAADGIIRFRMGID